MIIPHRQLSPEALQGLIEEFVTREGTEYGAREVPLDAKVAEVWRQLDTGAAVIVFNEADGSCTILPKDQMAEVCQAET